MGLAVEGEGEAGARVVGLVELEVVHQVLEP